MNDAVRVHASFDARLDQLRRDQLRLMTELSSRAQWWEAPQASAAFPPQAGKNISTYPCQFG